MQAVLERPATPLQPTLPRRLRLLCLAAPLAVFAAVLVLFGVQYEVNDDAQISCIAAGVFGSDTVHLCYVNILVGWLLKPLYLTAPGVNWYVVLCVGGLLGCAALLCRFAVQRFGTAGGLCLWLAGMVLAGVDALQAFQYTKIAAVFAATGAMLLARHLGDGPAARGPVAGGCALLLAGACLRWQSFLVVMAMAAPLLLLRLCPLRGAALRRGMLRVALPVLLCLAAWAVNEAAYRLDPAWDFWRRYNAARTEISDYRLQYLPGEDAAAYGLTPEEYALLENWDYGDLSLYPLERLEALAQALPHRTIPNGLREMLLGLPGWVFGTLPGWMLCAALLGWVLTAPKTPASARALAATLAVFLAGCYLLFYNGRLPWRVVYLMLTPCALLVAAQWGPLRGGATKVLAAALAVCVAVSFSDYQNRLGATLQYREDHAADSPKEQRLAALLKDQEHFYLVSTFHLDLFVGKNVWQTRPQGAFSHLAFLGGWAAQSPLYAESPAAWGLDPASLLTEAVDREVYLLDFDGIDTKCGVLSNALGCTVTAQLESDQPGWRIYTLHSEE